MSPLLALPLFTRVRSCRTATILSLMAVLVSACMEPPKPLPPQDAPYISPQQATVPHYQTYAGTTAATLNVDITARTPGYIEEILFTDGQDVKKDQALYTIEFTTNQAEADQARANLRVANANLQQSQLDYSRYQRLRKQKAVSEEDLEDKRLKMEQNKGSVEQAQAQLTEALKTLSYTHIPAPFNGRISRTLYDTGDLVGVNGQTVLTTLLQLDPLYVYFSVASTQLQSLLEARSKQGEMPIVFNLKGDVPLSFTGTLDFIDNQVSSTSGTIQMRATLANPDKSLYPGQFGNVQLKVGSYDKVLLIPQAVVKQDIEGSYLFTVDKDKKLQRKDVVLGDSFASWIIVKSGLTTDDHIISGHLMLMRAGLEVAPREDTNFPIPDSLLKFLKGPKVGEKATASTGAKSSGSTQATSGAVPTNETSTKDGASADDAAAADTDAPSGDQAASSNSNKGA